MRKRLKSYHDHETKHRIQERNKRVHKYEERHHLQHQRKQANFEDNNRTEILIQQNDVCLCSQIISYLADFFPRKTEGKRIYNQKIDNHTYEFDEDRYRANDRAWA